MPVCSAALFPSSDAVPQSPGAVIHSQCNYHTLAIGCTMLGRPGNSGERCQAAISGRERGHFLSFGIKRQHQALNYTPSVRLAG